MLFPPSWSWPFPHLPPLCLSSVSVRQDEAENFTWTRGAPAKFISLGITYCWNLCITLFLPIYLVSLLGNMGMMLPTDLHGHPAPHIHVLLPGQPFPVVHPLFLTHWPQNIGGLAADPGHYPLCSLYPPDVCACRAGRSWVLPLGSHGLWLLCGHQKPSSVHMAMSWNLCLALLGTSWLGEALSAMVHPTFTFTWASAAPGRWTASSVISHHCWPSTSVTPVSMNSYSFLSVPSFRLPWCWLLLCPTGSLLVLWYTIAHSRATSKQPLPVAPTS